MDTYAIGFRVQDDDGVIGDYFVQFEAFDNYTAYSTFAEFLEDWIAGGEQNNPIMIHEFARWWANSTIHLNHAPHSDHTLHMFNPYEREVWIIDGNYLGPHDELALKVWFTPRDFIRRYFKDYV